MVKNMILIYQIGLKQLIEKIKIKDYYTKKDNPDDYERLENIQELVSSISDFSDRNKNNKIEYI